MIVSDFCLLVPPFPPILSIKSTMIDDRIKPIGWNTRICKEAIIELFVNVLSSRPLPRSSESILRSEKIRAVFGSFCALESVLLCVVLFVLMCLWAYSRTRGPRFKHVQEKSSPTTKFSSRKRGELISRETNKGDTKYKIENLYRLPYHDIIFPPFVRAKGLKANGLGGIERTIKGRALIPLLAWGRFSVPLCVALVDKQS